MSGFFTFLEHAVNGVAESIAMKQAMGPASASPGRGGKLKKRGKADGEECTPCAAMGEVDAMRKSMGFSTK